MGEIKADDMQEIVVGAGKLVLENGGETYRAEDTIVHVASALGAKSPSAFVTPTVILFSYIDENGKHHSFMRRIFHRGIHLNRLAQINALSRRLWLKQKNADAQMVENLLHRIEKSPSYSNGIVVFAAGLSSLFFTLMFSGTVQDAFFSFCLGALLRFLLIILEKTQVGQNSFMLSLISGLFLAAAANICAEFDETLHSSIILMGTIMQVVPGLALVNGIRDIISGDFVSGGARLLDACMIALGLSVGAVAALVILGFFL